MYLAYLLGVVGDDGTDDAERVKALPVALKQELLEYAEKLRFGTGHPNDHICIWYDEQTHRCKYHDMRPQICRDFEMNSQECQGRMQEYGIGPD